MNLYQEWKNTIASQTTQEQQMAFWDDFCKQEQGIYESILGNSQKRIQGKVSQLTKEHNISEVYFLGFLDGINDSLVAPMDVESVEGDSNIDIEIDFEKLYYNMHAVPAQWLYTLPQWNNILSEEKREEIAKQQKRDKTVVKDPKVGRNDPCPCGSGKKYKKCCGK